ncbi:MAG: IS607 family transposase [Candidatus Kapaibacterium sp.]|nr:MAG: IS607 family transposase [Candidatus Kapabacteria bacterium]
MNKLLTIEEAAQQLGVSSITLRRWEKAGKITATRTQGGHRRYVLADIAPHLAHQSAVVRSTLAYARVSSHDQREDLERQKRVLEMYCAAQGWQFQLIADLGSGMNYHKKGLRTLLNTIIDGTCGRLVLTHKDRLLRFGAELVFAVCEAKNVEVVIINKGAETTFEEDEDLAHDVLEIITVFSARLYDLHSHKNKKIIDGIKEVVEQTQAQE